MLKSCEMDVEMKLLEIVFRVMRKKKVEQFSLKRSLAVFEVDVTTGSKGQVQ